MEILKTETAASLNPGLVSCDHHANQSGSRVRTWLRSPALFGSRIWTKVTYWYIYGADWQCNHKFQLHFKLSVIGPSDAVNTGMVNQTGGHQLALSCSSPSSVSSLVDWLVGLLVDKKCSYPRMVCSPMCLLTFTCFWLVTSPVLAQNTELHPTIIYHSNKKNHEPLVHQSLVFLSVCLQYEFKIIRVSIIPRWNTYNSYDVSISGPSNAIRSRFGKSALNSWDCRNLTGCSVLWW
jgi:hypothetical protein